MIKKVLLCTVLITLSCTAQKKSKNTPIQKYLSTITAVDLKKHLTIVASDEMEGRDTGTEGQKKAGRYLIEQYQKNGISFPEGATDFYQKVPSEFMKSNYGPKLNDSENIWAYIKGTEKPDEILVISAHYDHVGVNNGEIFNGADDDGSGTVALLEMAQAFQMAKKQGNGPKRSILFLHVTGEEHGLHGSRYYVKNPVFPLKNTIANINIDMIGRRDFSHPNTNNYVYVIGADRLSRQLHDITVATNEKYIKMDLDFKYNDMDDPNHFYERSDHYNFAKNGIPAVFLFNGEHEDYHKKTDEVSKIEFDALTKRTQLAFAIAWELANRSQRIVVDQPNP